MMVSVLVPIYNEEEYLEEAIQSFVEQDYKEKEIILVDNGSSDRTFEIAKKFEEKYPEIIQAYSIDKGKNKALNFAFERSKGDLILFFAGDDILTEGSLRERAKAMEKFNPLTDMAGGYAKLKMISKNPKFDGVEVPKAGIAKGTASGGTIVMTRKLSEKVFPIPESLPNEDQWMTLCIENFNIPIVQIPKIVLNYRIHEHNSTAFVQDFAIRNKALTARSKVYQLFLDKFGSEISEDKRRYVATLVELEKYRIEGKVFKILMAKNIGLKSKLSWCAYTNKFLYFIRFKFYKLFTGV
ncbi:glycosyltransferase family 2 protein [Clostridium paraputrificum]|uniref:glycosyltransferase family 2 protein n=1 Tax=Clostridium TaxID=1485 RepID=UPI003D3403FE